MDLFNPTDAPKDVAISQAIDRAVEKFIAGDIQEANHCFDMAEVFANTPEELFASTPTPQLERK
jgi:hypothetical protein